MDTPELRVDKRSGGVRCTIGVDRPPAEVYAVLGDVESWPQWLPTVTSVRRTEPGDGGGPGPSGAFRVKQPRLPVATWRVTRAAAPYTFTWVNARGGVTVTAGHVIEPDGAGGSRVTLTIDQSGPLRRLVAPFTTALTATYVRTEAEALKRRCENPPQDQQDS
ncbi:SRPBCC family protein [Actinacidiphila acididurans]|uniref:SRPBCC family protein n=1 Tax=Actinacidiphila acididurans TaxID=2784346 RepID=A0ABS2U0Y4_9ACTN|nr:SRPBCC family protein [Actinacidiphila acididurans]MBM9509007.1 SRPBCC family protein [Actinacidiphila acididurans]